MEAEVPFALLEAGFVNPEVKIGETEDVALTYISYGSALTGTAIVEDALDSSIRTEGELNLKGEGQETELTLKLTLPDDGSLTGQRDFRVITQAGDATLTNNFSATVIPEPAFLALLALLAFCFKRR